MEKKGTIFSLRQKFLVGFGSLFLIIVIIGVQSIIRLTELGQSIDVILRENFRSVIACQEMKEALERLDSGILFIILGNEKPGNEHIQQNLPLFEKALRVELDNITLPGEGERANLLRTFFAEYRQTLQLIQNPAASSQARQNVYFNRLLPIFQSIKNTANEILQMNQQNMEKANRWAREQAAAARGRMYLALFIGTILALGFIYLTNRWILRPVMRLTRSVEEIKQGNLEIVIPQNTNDEIGQLSGAFNDMTASLRDFRRSSQARVVRMQQATQQAFNSLPEAIAVVDPEGQVEVATEPAKSIFNLMPNMPVSSSTEPWIEKFFRDTIRNRQVTIPNEKNALIQRFVDGDERYFRPRAVPILDHDEQPTGVTIIFEDVTLLREQIEMKRGLISTVSHQLKTPLTSIRMAIHLILDEKAGPITNKQSELLMAARDDSERLQRIIGSLLDISRMQAGKTEIQPQPVSPYLLVTEAIESFQREASDKGIELATKMADGLPDVRADKDRISHVFANLLANALRYTPRGGRVTVSAEGDDEIILFSIADTGSGIPRKYLGRIFEQFFRVPGQEPNTGAGLGLAIVKEIVEAHGGAVSVNSQEGDGTVFMFTLSRVDRTH